jgi:hypothetical protein
MMGTLGACALSLVATTASAATIDYSNVAGNTIGTGSTIDFDPTDTCVSDINNIGCISFTPASTGADSGFDLVITSGTANGFNGNIAGTFGVQPISSPGGGVETADVTGSGTLTIDDGSTDLTATLDWVEVVTFGALGGVNPNATVNLSNISYAGSNADLLALFNGGAGIQTLTFQFGAVTSLTDLFTVATSVTKTSYSGSITPVPVPAAVWLFGSGLLGLVGIARRKQV